MTRVCARSSTF